MALTICVCLAAATLRKRGSSTPASTGRVPAGSIPAAPSCTSTAKGCCPHPPASPTHTGAGTSQWPPTAATTTACWPTASTPTQTIQQIPRRCRCNARTTIRPASCSSRSPMAGLPTCVTGPSMSTSASCPHRHSPASRLVHLPTCPASPCGQQSPTPITWHKMISMPWKIRAPQHQ
jgi:hypothetical protein